MRSYILLGTESETLLRTAQGAETILCAAQGAETILHTEAAHESEIKSTAESGNMTIVGELSVSEGKYRSGHRSEGGGVVSS
jgi:hypothetical protein